MTADHTVLRRINKGLLTLGFVLGNLLWIKALVDTATFQRYPLPGYFPYLFGLGAVLALGLSAYCLIGLPDEPREGKLDIWTALIWLSIPLSVLCTSPVCYSGTIFIAPYPMSTVIRLSLLLVPLLPFALYLRRQRQPALLILLALGLFLLIPNDQCYNAFNYRWIDWIGASPLTYVPTLFVLLFAVAGLYGKNKYLITVIVLGLCLAALFISLGHRTGLLW